MQVEVHDGGLCFIAPFLNNFFENLSVVTHNEFVNEYQKAKAYVILQYIVNGSVDYENINNSLAYYFAAKPNLNIEKDVQLSESEIEECNILLHTIIGYIPNLQHLSIDSFQKEFLQREGVLYLNTNELTIQRKSIDVIMDNIPWNIHLIKLPWLKNIIKAEW